MFFNKKKVNKQPTQIRQFYINLTDSNSIYYKPKDHINGEVFLELKKNLANCIIKLSLVGQIKIKSNKKTFSFLNRSINILDNTINDSTDNVQNKGILLKGIHKFPFNIKLPKKKLLNSIKFEKGNINYFLYVELIWINPITKQLEILSDCRCNFYVQVPLDVSIYNKPREKTVVLQNTINDNNNNNTNNNTTNNTTSSSIHLNLYNTTNNNNNNNNDSISSTFTTNSSGSLHSNNSLASNGSINTNKIVNIKVSIPKSGYIIGELIPITINLQHYKQYYHTAGVIATLVRICRIGDPLEMFRKDICQCITPLVLDDSLNFQKTVYLKLPPDIFATLKNTMFSFNYFIEVMVNLSHKNQIYNNANKLVEGNDNIIYNDMIDVEILKRLRNVIGMSIEIIVGNTCKKAASNINDESISSQGKINNTNNSNSNNVNSKLSINDTDSFDHLDDNNSEILNGNSLSNFSSNETSLQQTTSENISNWIPRSGLPVPEYTPNNSNQDNETNDNENIDLLSTVNKIPDYSTLTINSNNNVDTDNNSNSINDDKQELERKRLQQLESEPTFY